MTLNKILYIGAADHIQPVRDFSEAKEFIFIDSQPLYFRPGSGYCERSMYMLFFTLSVYGFKKVEERILDTLDNTSDKAYINPTLLIFQNESTGQILKYYVSCPFPFEFSNKDEVLKDIGECDGLVVSGFFPDAQLFDYFKNMKSFIGYSKSCFYESDRNTLVDSLHTNERDNYFESFCFVEELLESRELHWAFYHQSEHELFRHHLTNFLSSDVKPEKHMFANFSDFYEFSEYFNEEEDDESECCCSEEDADEDMSDVLVL